VNPLRITYVVASLHTAHAGTEGHVLRLIRGLDRDRYSPHLIVLQPSEWLQQWQDERVPHEVLGFRSFARPDAWRCLGRLTQRIRELRSQIVELHFFDAHVLGAVAARRARVPVVISCRRDLGHQYTAKIVTLSRMVNPWITRFLANSQQVAQVISRREALSLDRFDVIPNGVDLPGFDLQASRPLESTLESAWKGKRVVALLANLRPVKNVEGFLHAARRIVDVAPQTRFVVLGEGSEGARLKAVADSLHLASHIYWLGSVSDPARYLRRADVGCLTSHAEGFSNAIVEYMAAALPVVATRVGGAEEAVTEGATGFLVAPGDMDAMATHVLRLLHDESERKRLGQAGRQRVVDHFTHHLLLERYHEYYASLWNDYAP
jgi:L-malate glycosyltransferase